MTVHVNQDVFKLNGTDQLLVYVDVLMLCGSTRDMKKITDFSSRLRNRSTWSCLEIRMQDEVTV